MKRITLFTIIAVVGVNVADAAQTFIPGKLKEEYWQGSGNGPFKADVEAGTAGTPTFIRLLPSFELPVNVAENYSARVSGVFIPAATGDYVFILSADDTADLFLSTDANPANKRTIAQQPGWNSNRRWVTDQGGGNDLQQKTSSTWVNAAGATPFANGIHLLAGTQYYIEGVMNEFGGGDNMEVTFYLTTESPPADGDAPKLTGSVIGVNVASATTLTFTSQPQNTTAYAGTLAQFSVTVQTDSEIAPSYQWRKGGAIITNATASTYSRIAATADNAAQFDCVVTVPGLTNTSSAATLTVRTGALTVNGKLKNEFYSGRVRAEVENGSGGKPTFVSEFTSFHAPVNFADNFTRRVSGYFIPAASGNYVFFVSSDDDSDLFLSTDDSPVNKRLIAQEQNWSGDLSWVSSGGTSSLSQKRSDQWSPDGGATTPYSAGIALVAGTKYYIEGVAHEGGGGDDFAATFKLLADADPADNTAPALTGPVIAYITSPVTGATITNQPQNVTVYESQAVTLSVGVQTDSEVSPTYQWRKGGGNIAGATAATFIIAYAVTADAGSYDCVVTIPNFANTLTSSAATVAVQTAPLGRGYLKYEYFPLSTRQAVEANTAGNPSFGGNTIGSDKSGAATIFETGVNFADNYANRFSGLFLPPATGDYVFFISGDDDSDLFLSTDDRPANKRMIAQEVSWSNNRSWNTAGGGTSTSAQKRSDQFSPDGGQTFPFATGIHMVAGQRYYIEGVHHEGGGGDDFGATYIVYGDADPADGSTSTLTGNVIGVLVPPQPLTITQQPSNTTVQEQRKATFTVAATTTGFYPPTYQWKKGGVNIAGATKASYTTPSLTLADNNSQFVCTVSIAGTAPTDSQTATLTVVPDTFPPALFAVGSLLKGTAVEIGVGFDEPVDKASATNAANYTLSTGTVSGVRFQDIITPGAGAGSEQSDSAQSAVVLTTSGLSSGANVTLTVRNVRDLKGNPIPSTGITKTITTTSKMKWAAIGGDELKDGSSANAAIPGTWTDDAVAYSDKDFDLVSSGSAYWDNYDEATFVYESITGDFDKKVRVEYQDASSQWARAGLQLREVLNEGVTRDQRYDETTNPTGEKFAQNFTIRVNPVQGWINPATGNAVPGNNSYEVIHRPREGYRYTAYNAIYNINAGFGGAPAYPNAWMRLQRKGQTVTCWKSDDGVTWTGGANVTYTNDPDTPEDETLSATLFVGVFWGPELLNNGIDGLANVGTGLGHSVHVKFREYGDVAAARPSITSVRLTSGNVIITYPAGTTLQSTPSLTSPNWAPVTGATSPYSTQPTGAERYFRLSQP